MEIAREDLMELVDQTWQTLFGDSVSELDATSRATWDIRSEVAIRGAWNGLVTLLLPAAAAEQIACRMLEAKPGELAAEEILDAAGEMVNILAGNLKSMLPQPSFLGLPVIRSRDSGEGSMSTSDQHLSLCCTWSETHFSAFVSTEAGATGE